MQKLIHKYFAIIIILFFLETIAAGALFFLMDNEVLKDFIQDIIVGVMFLVILVNLIVMVLILNKISKTRHKTDIASLNVIGKDIQKAYDFGKIGLVITNETDEIVWTNSFFNDIQGRMIDKSIFEWEPKLKEILTSSLKEIKVEINNRHYQVKYLQDARIYIFKDVTNLELAAKYNYENAPAVGLITIDNYQDMMSILDDISINDSLAAVQKAIVEYAKKYNLLLKKYKSDSYLFICKRDDYQKMILDRFSLLQTVREEDDNKDNDLTISIGVACGIDNYSRLFEMASTALDVALSRGGNQAVISTHGENLRFIGGQSEAKEKKNTVQSRVMSNSLKAIISDYNSVYIMGHATADLDAIGSALGVYSFASTICKKVKIVYDEFSLESKTKKAFKRLFSKEEIAEMTISPTKAIDEFNSRSLLIVVDVHNPANTMSPSLVKKADKVAIIDHHRRGEKCIENALFNYIDPSSSSASEMIAEMIRYSEMKIDVTPEIATFMLAGIILDTNYYRNKIGARTYDASYILKNFGADNGIADSFLKQEYEEYALKTKIMSNSITPHYGVIVAMADQKDIVEQAMLASVAMESLQIAGVNACFVIGRIAEKEVGVSSRSDGTVSCQILCEKLGGGGSFTSAAAKFSNMSVEEVANRVKNVLDQYLSDARSKKVGD